MTDYQTIFLNKFLTFFNCQVQPLADNLELVEGCQCMAEMTKGEYILSEMARLCNCLHMSIIEPNSCQGVPKLNHSR